MGQVDDVDRISIEAEELVPFSGFPFSSRICFSFHDVDILSMDERKGKKLQHDLFYRYLLEGSNLLALVVSSFLEWPSLWRESNQWYVSRLRLDNFFEPSYGSNVKKCFVARLPKNPLLHGTVAQWTQQTSHRSRSV